MSAVLGVDPSLTATCTCLIGPSGDPLVEVRKTTSKTGTHDEKHQRMLTQVAHVAARAARCDLVAVEGLSHASHGAATRDLAGLWWLIYDGLAALEVPVAVVAPAVRAKWATGKGNAGKFEVGQHIAKRWPGVELRSDDEADALVLASIALHRQGRLPWEPIKPQVEAMTKVAWPDPTAIPASDGNERSRNDDQSMVQTPQHVPTNGNGSR